MKCFEMKMDPNNHSNYQWTQPNLVILSIKILKGETSKNLIQN